MSEIGFPELVMRLDAIIALLVVTLPQPEQPRFVARPSKTAGRGGLGADRDRANRGQTAKIGELGACENSGKERWQKV